MKKQFRILLAVLLMASLAFTAFACAPRDRDDDDSSSDTPIVTVETVEISVVNGTIGETGYNHDVVEEGTEVTVVANEAASAEEAFSHWEIAGEQVSTESSYTLTVNEDTTVTAVYGSNYSVWNGEYPETAPDEFVIDEDAKTFHIGSASALAYWAALVTNDASGLDRTNYAYSTFHWGEYTRRTTEMGYTNENSVPAEVAAEVAAQCYDASNQWTVSIECNIDLNGYEWTPINDNCYALNDMIIDGNNHVIKNFYSTYHNSGELFATSMHGSGFFGNLTGTNITIQNLTFDSALTEVTGTASRLDGQNLALVIGYAHGGRRATYFPNDDHQLTKFDNVNVINSVVMGSDGSAKAGLLIGRVGTSNEAITEKQHVVVANCTFTNNTIIASQIVGVIGGHLYSADMDVTVRDQHIFDVYNIVIEDFTAITSANGTGESAGEGTAYGVGTLGCWDRLVWAADDPSGANTWYSTIVNIDLNNQEVNLIDLHSGTSSVVTNLTMMNNYLTGGTANIFVAADIVYESELAQPDWTPNEDQMVYLVAGATVTGLDLGENVRLISGARNADGDLIVTDTEGNVIGAWVVTDYVGAFVAA